MGREAVHGTRKFLCGSNDPRERNGLRLRISKSLRRFYPLCRGMATGSTVSIETLLSRANSPLLGVEMLDSD